MVLFVEVPRTNYAILFSYMVFLKNMILDIFVYFQISNIFSTIFKKYVHFFFFEDNLAQHVVISLNQQWRHTQSIQSYCQVSWWSNCLLVFKNPNQLKLFLMMSLVSRQGSRRQDSVWPSGYRNLLLAT